MGVDVANGQLDAPRLAASPWPYFAGLVVATWVLDLVWHAQFAAHRGGFAVTVSWLIMTLAMMTPTTVPMLGSLVDVVARREPRPFWLFLVGYLAVWAAIAFAIAQAQVALAARRHGLIIRPLGDSILFVPPISIQPDEVKHLVRAVRLAMEETLEGLNA